MQPIENKSDPSSGPGVSAANPGGQPPYHAAMSTPSYRHAAPSNACPRCGRNLTEMPVHEAVVLDCAACGGCFLPTAVVHALGRADGHELRRAFPVRPRPAEPAAVRYLKCPLCERIMNRIDFAKPSRVIIDICSEHGSWFDVGEISGVIDFVEQGGLERARQRLAQERETEKAKLKTELSEAMDPSTAESLLMKRVFLP